MGGGFQGRGGVGGERVPKCAHITGGGSAYQISMLSSYCQGGGGGVRATKKNWIRHCGCPVS